MWYPCLFWRVATKLDASNILSKEPVSSHAQPLPSISKFNFFF